MTDFIDEKPIEESIEIEPAYEYSAPKIDILRLQAQLKDGLPIENVRISKDLSIDWDWTRQPTEAEFQLSYDILAAHDEKDDAVVPDKSLEEKISILEVESLRIATLESESLLNITK